MNKEIISFDKTKIVTGNQSRYFLVEHFLENVDYSSVIVFCDENTRSCCLPHINDLLKEKIDTLNVIYIPEGEKAKSLHVFQDVVNNLLFSNADRNSLMVNLGGGTITDLGGFIASVYKRGIPFINIPTTLMGMIDAAIGNKTAVNFKEYKNILGTFSPPEAVIIDTVFLKTLTENEFRSAFSEIYKYALIDDELELFDLLAESDEQEFRQSLYNFDLINKCIRSKLKFVRRDPFDRSYRHALNLGHTIGHAVESVFISQDKSLLHGEAVAVGLLCELYISHKLLKMKKSVLESAWVFLGKYFELIDIQSVKDGILEVVRHDKKKSGEDFRMTLLAGIGNVKVRQIVNEEMISESLNYYCNNCR